MRIDVTFAHHHSTIHYALLYIVLHSLAGVTAVSNESHAVPWDSAIVEAEDRRHLATHQGSLAALWCWHLCRVPKHQTGWHCLNCLRTVLPPTLPITRPGETAHVAEHYNRGRWFPSRATDQGPLLAEHTHGKNILWSVSPFSLSIVRSSDHTR